MKKLSKRQNRIAQMHLADYAKLMRRPQRGVITYGGGLNILAWMAEAETQGYHCTMTPGGVVLR